MKGWQILNVHFFNGLSHSDWFKSYGDFDEWVDLAYCWSCIGKGLRKIGEAGLFRNTVVFSYLH